MPDDAAEDIVPLSRAVVRYFLVFPVPLILIAADTEKSNYHLSQSPFYSKAIRPHRI